MSLIPSPTQEFWDIAAASKYPPFIVGYKKQEKRLIPKYIAEEERENHFWVCGSTGQGKSKFLEYLLRHDIQRLKADAGKDKEDWKGCPTLLIDPTPGGGVVKSILAFCQEIGFEKVFLIDPHEIQKHKKVPPINLFSAPKSKITSSVEYLVDAFRVLYDIEDQGRTAVITKYLSCIFTVLHYAGLTAHDLRNFTLPLDKDIPELEKYESMRWEIYRRAQKNAEDEPFHVREILDQHIEDLRIGYKNILSFRQEMGTTARRINQITAHPDLSLIFGHRDGVEFTNLVGDRWLILVNISDLGTMPARLLATVVLNQFIFAVERLRKEEHGFDVPAYIYLDEASKYATDKLIDVLDVRRNSKIRMILSHQHPEQLRKRKILDSVKANCLTKVAFYLADNEHREDMIRTMYGGELSVKDVSYSLSDQEKQTVALKSGKAPAEIIRIPHVKAAQGSASEWAARLLARLWYYSYDEIEQDYADRYKGLPPEDSQSAQPAKKTHRKATGKASVPRRVSRESDQNLPPDNEAGGTNEKRKPLSI